MQARDERDIEPGQTEPIYIYPEDQKTQQENRDRLRARTAALMLLSGLIGAIIGGLIVGYAFPAIYGGTPSAVYSQQSNVSGNNVKDIINVSNTPDPAAAVAKKLGPSVVSIDTAAGPNDSIHQGLTTGVGSGVIYRPDGYIVTNNHVVSGARSIFVTIGTDEIPANLVATDPETDLAVIKVAKTNLPVAELGSTKNLQIGSPAVAIGSPFGFSNTVTSGIISALNRNVTVPDQESGSSTTYTNLTQTDAAINPGNSGGALSDAQGKVIGVNTLILSTSGESNGVGFAIPVEFVKKIANQLISTGKADHPYVGLSGRNVTEIAGLESNINVDEGVIITSLAKGGPAEKSGLLKNDIVVAANGKPINNVDDLIAVTRDHNSGDSITISYIRNGIRRTTNLVLADRPR